MQTSTYALTEEKKLEVNNPGGGDCCFFAFAIGLLPYLRADLRKGDNTRIDLLLTILSEKKKDELINCIKAGNLTDPDQQYLVSMNQALRQLSYKRKAAEIAALPLFISENDEKPQSHYFPHSQLKVTREKEKDAVESEEKKDEPGNITKLALTTWRSNGNKIEITQARDNLLIFTVTDSETSSTLFDQLAYYGDSKPEQKTLCEIQGKLEGLFKKSFQKNSLQNIENAINEIVGQTKENRQARSGIKSELQSFASKLLGNGDYGEGSTDFEEVPDFKKRVKRLLKENNNDDEKVWEKLTAPPPQQEQKENNQEMSLDDALRHITHNGVWGSDVDIKFLAELFEVNPEIIHGNNILGGRTKHKETVYMKNPHGFHWTTKIPCEVVINDITEEIMATIPPQNEEQKIENNEQKGNIKQKVILLAKAYDGQNPVHNALENLERCLRQDSFTNTLLTHLENDEVIPATDPIPLLVNAYKENGGSTDKATKLEASLLLVKQLYLKIHPDSADWQKIVVDTAETWFKHRNQNAWGISKFFGIHGASERTLQYIEDNTDKRLCRKVFADLAR